MLGAYSINCDTRLLNDICNYHCALNTGSFFYKHNRKQIVSGYLLCWEKDDKSVQRNVLTVTLKTAQNCVYEVFVYINEYILKVNKKSNHIVRILTCHWIQYHRWLHRYKMMTNHRTVEKYVQMNHNSQWVHPILYWTQFLRERIKVMLSNLSTSDWFVAVILSFFSRDL